MLMVLYISLLLTLYLIPSNVMVTPLSITICPSIISISTSISIQPLIVGTKTSFLICKEVRFLIIQCLKIYFIEAHSTNTHNINTLEDIPYHIFRQYIQLGYHLAIFSSLFILLDLLFVILKVIGYIWSSRVQDALLILLMQSRS